jgi:DNA-binding IclR family transcriptional regulator
LLGLALGTLDREPLVAAARPVLERHAQALGETFFLVVARGGTLLVLDKAEGTGLLRVSPRVGSAVPVHASAVGKLYLAHAPELVALEPKLTRFTARTIVSPRKLARPATPRATASGSTRSPSRRRRCCARAACSARCARRCRARARRGSSGARWFTR